MKVKVGDVWFESTFEQPICVLLEPGDKEFIRNMPEDKQRVLQFVSLVNKETGEKKRYHRFDTEEKRLAWAEEGPTEENTFTVTWHKVEFDV